MLKKSLLVSALTLCLAGNVWAQDEESAESTGPWEISADVALTSDYVFRGVSQSQESAALQAGLNFEHETGFYAGIWGSSVDFTDQATLPADEDGANVEIDAFIGYGFDINDQWTGDVQLQRYFYPGANSGIDYDYNELIGSVSYNEMITASVGYSNDVFATRETGIWFGLEGSYGLPWWELSLTGEIGRYDMNGLNDDGSDLTYVHYGLGFARDFGPVSTSLKWTNTDDDGQAYFGETGDSRVFLTVEMSTGL